MIKAIKEFAYQFLKETEQTTIKVISHHDTDGITSASIITKALQRLDREFSLTIVKQLEESVIKNLPEGHVILFVDLASNSFNYLKEIKNKVFILDHHEINSEIPENVSIINPHLFNEEEISGAGLAYLFAKELNEENTDLAYLAIIGMVGDQMGKSLGKIYTQILKDSNIELKKGITLYPATRPLNKILEYSSDIFIPEVTGSSEGSVRFLREMGIGTVNGKYKSIIELNEEETSKLITAISVHRTDNGLTEDLIGNIFLVNFFSRLEDARQISAMINSCSRLGESATAISFCLQKRNSKEKVDSIYAKYRQNIVKALNALPILKKIERENYVIINAEDKIKDTMIGTIASIISNSKEYPEGKAIIAMAYNEDKIKVSARMVGKSGRNIRELLNSVIEIVGGEVGGHHAAAGCNFWKN
ncbi:DHH family phosphoesterase [Candidatus Pacearchaeota archaeon]|nr:DHH family phosphoesterase [Candidatus Pacearchaeota archaeon]